MYRLKNIANVKYILYKCIDKLISKTLTFFLLNKKYIYLQFI